MLVPMKPPKGHSCDTEILETLSRRVMVGDGAMGTQLQAADLTLDDFTNRRRRGRDEICWPPIGSPWMTTTGPTRPASRARGRRDRQAGRVELGVQTPGDDV